MIFGTAMLHQMFFMPVITLVITFEIGSRSRYTGMCILLLAKPILFCSEQCTYTCKVAEYGRELTLVRNGFTTVKYLPF